jgi:hypothetical protein
MNNGVSNYLLVMMLLSYSIPIIYIFYYYSKENQSVSSIINSEKCQKYIFTSMIIMGVFTILYEINRGCKFSLCFISTILFGIYGVILIKENKKIHYLFAGLVFIGIVLFMGMNCYKYCYNDNKEFLKLSLYIQFILCIVLVVSMDKDIFFCEILLIINFAIFYLYLHYLHLYT